jgi:predicted nucleic acid-binding protein
MNADVFVDTNIFVYAQVSGDGEKHPIARDLLKRRLLDENVFISTQVLGEFYSAMSKYKRTHTEISRLLNEMIRDSNVAVVKLQTVQNGLEIVEKYGYSYWDSLLLATAIENDCEIIYSEDMQHKQIIEGKLTILNPFAQ